MNDEQTDTKKTNKKFPANFIANAKNEVVKTKIDTSFAYSPLANTNTEEAETSLFIGIAHGGKMIFGKSEAPFREKGTVTRGLYPLEAVGIPKAKQKIEIILLRVLEGLGIALLNARGLTDPGNTPNTDSPPIDIEGNEEALKLSKENKTLRDHLKRMGDVLDGKVLVTSITYEGDSNLAFKGQKTFSDFLQISEFMVTLNLLFPKFDVKKLKRGLVSANADVVIDSQKHLGDEWHVFHGAYPNTAFKMKASNDNQSLIDEYKLPRDSSSSRNSSPMLKNKVHVSVSLNEMDSPVDVHQNMINKGYYSLPTTPRKDETKLINSRLSIKKFHQSFLEPEEFNSPKSTRLKKVDDNKKKLTPPDEKLERSEDGKNETSEEGPYLWNNLSSNLQNNSVEHAVNVNTNGDASVTHEKNERNASSKQSNSFSFSRYLCPGFFGRIKNTQSAYTDDDHTVNTKNTKETAKSHGSVQPAKEARFDDEIGLDDKVDFRTSSKR